MEACVSIIALLVLVVIFLICKFHEYSMQKELKERVAWCVTNDNHKRGNSTLVDWLWTLQFKDNPDSFYPHAGKVPLIEKEFRFTLEERDSIKYIIKAFQNNMIQTYFNEQLFLYKNLTKAEYFITTLNDFLHKYVYYGESLFEGKQVYDFEEGSKIITDFGKVVYKILLITLHYDLNFIEGEINQQSIVYQTYNRLKKIIASGKIED